MNYASNLGGKYTNTLTQEIEDFKRRIEALHAARAAQARPVGAAAHERHNQILDALNRELPGFGRDWTLYQSPFAGSTACTLNKDGKRGVLLHSDVAAMDSYNETYQGFREVNTHATVTPAHFFDNVVFHEYMHLHFEKVLPQMDRVLYNGPFKEFCDSKEVDEAIAFWFGDRMTKLKSPLDDLSACYIRQGVNFPMLRKVYETLQADERPIAEILQPSNLIDILRKN